MPLVDNSATLTGKNSRLVQHPLDNKVVAIAVSQGRTSPYSDVSHVIHLLFPILITIGFAVRHSDALGCDVTRELQWLRFLGGFTSSRDCEKALGFQTLLWM